MITAKGTNLAYAMCMGCPVEESVKGSFCHARTSMEEIKLGNRCFLDERAKGGMLVARDDFTASVSYTDATGALKDEEMPLSAIVIRTGVVVQQTPVYTGIIDELPNMLGWSTIDLSDWLKEQGSVIYYVN